MLRLVKTLIIYLVIYSLGFLSGMNYHGQDKATALKEDITHKAKSVGDHGKRLIKTVGDQLTPRDQ